MKKIPFVLLLLLLAAHQAAGQNGNISNKPVHYGNFEEMVHAGNVKGVVGLSEALDGPHVFAVGATAGGAGEITAIDGRIWLDYGSDGLGNASRSIPPEEEAVLLVVIQVNAWRDIRVPYDMNEVELYEFILSQAERVNLNIEHPFPFLLEGKLLNIDWHVLDGKKLKLGGHGKGGLFKKVSEHLPSATGEVVGFYSAETQGVYTHPGESWHLHVVMDDQKKAGHVDALAVAQGTILRLPK
jgi:alpha-acetolactate decarboxylase